MQQYIPLWLLGNIFERWQSDLRAQACYIEVISCARAALPPPSPSLISNRAPLKGISSGNARFTATLCGTVSTYEYLQRGVDQGERQDTQLLQDSSVYNARTGNQQNRMPTNQTKWPCWYSHEADGKCDVVLLAFLHRVHHLPAQRK